MAQSFLPFWMGYERLATEDEVVRLYKSCLANRSLSAHSVTKVRNRKASVVGKVPEGVQSCLVPMLQT